MKKGGKRKTPMLRFATSINKMYSKSMQAHAKLLRRMSKKKKKINCPCKQTKKKQKQNKNAMLAMNEWRQFKVTFK